MITVACVWVKGNVPYGAEYVTRLYSMVSRHLERFQFVCLTDRPVECGAAIADILKHYNPFRVISIPSPAPLAGWWSKLELFNPANGLSGRVFYLDLDVLVVGDLAPLIDFEVDGRASLFALVPPGGDFQPKDYRTVRRYNSSVMVFEPSARLARLFTEFDPIHALPMKGPSPRLVPLWGDQDWIGERLPDADLMPLEWFPRVSAIAGRAPPEARVVLCKKPKPHAAARMWPWVAEAWC